MKAHIKNMTIEDISKLLNISTKTAKALQKLQDCVEVEIEVEDNKNTYKFT